MRKKKTDRLPYIFSIIIPVLHESEIINALIQHLQRLESTYNFEIIVVDGSIQKDTITAITDQGVITLVSAQGRGRQMNIGAAVAHGEILIFLHADTQIPKNALQLIQKVFAQPGCDGGAFTLDIDSKNPILKMIALLSSIRSQLMRIPYGDQVIFLRKTYFEHIGGYTDIPLLEDVELMQRIKKSGGKIRILPDKVVTSARRWNEQGIAYTTLLNILILVLYFCRFPPSKLQKWHRYTKE